MDDDRPCLGLGGDDSLIAPRTDYVTNRLTKESLKGPAIKKIAFLRLP